MLVVDDDPRAVELLSRTLQGAGMRVVTASRGPEALTLAQQLKPSAITLDVQLPEMDDWEILRELKANPATRDIPVMDGFEFVGHLRQRDPAGSIPIVVLTAKDVSDDDRQRLLGSVSSLIERQGQDLEILLDRVRNEVLRSRG